MEAEPLCLLYDFGFIGGFRGKTLCFVKDALHSARSAAQSHLCVCVFFLFSPMADLRAVEVQVPTLVSWDSGGRQSRQQTWTQKLKMGLRKTTLGSKAWPSPASYRNSSSATAAPSRNLHRLSQSVFERKVLLALDDADEHWPRSRVRT